MSCFSNVFSSIPDLSCILGDQASFKEDLDTTVGSNNKTEAMLVYSVEDRERELVVESENGLESWDGTVRFYVFNTLQTRPIISVVDDVRSWKTGNYKPICWFFISYVLYYSDK